MNNTLFDFIRARRGIFAALLLILVSFVAYSNSLQGEFMMDDYGIFFNSSIMHNLKYALTVFTASDVTTHKKLFYYRPVSRMFRMLLYCLFEKDVVYYHLVNIALFSLNLIVMYVLLKMLFDDHLTALLTCLLFGAHPIHGMAVNYLSAHEVSLFGIFSYLSLICSLMYFRNQRKIVFYILSVILFVLGLLTQELVITLPFYLVLILLFVKQYPPKRVLLFSLPFFLVSAGYFLFRLQFASVKLNLFDNTGFFDLNAVSYFVSVAELMAWYVSKLIYPDGIVLIWSIQPAAANLIGKAAAFLCLGLGVGFLLWKFRHRKIILFSAAWLGIGFLPLSLLCFVYPAMGLVIEPHWFFFSSAGFFLFLALGFKYLREKAHKIVWVMLLCGALFALAGKTREYNHLWSNEERYCRYWLTITPHNHGPQFWLGYHYFRTKDYSQAKTFFEKSLVNQFIDWEVFTNLGLIEKELGNRSKALEYLKKALYLFPTSAIVQNNLGTVYLMQGQTEEAEEYFSRAIRYDRYLAEPRLNLAKIYEKKGKISEAQKLYEENIGIDPLEGNSVFLLTKSYFQTGEKKKAVALGKRILKSGNDAVLLTNIGSVFAQNRYHELANALFSKALKRDPLYKNVYLEFGKLMGNQEKFHLAVNFWREGLRLFPDEKEFSVLIEQAAALMKEKPPSWDMNPIPPLR